MSRRVRRPKRRKKPPKMATTERVWPVERRTHPAQHPAYLLGFSVVGWGLRKELVLMGRVVDSKSTTELVLGLASMSKLLSLLLLRRGGFGETVEKRRKIRFAILAIFFFSN